MDLGQIFNNIPHPPGCNCNTCTCNNFYAPPPQQNNCGTGGIDICTLLVLFMLFSGCNNNNVNQTIATTSDTCRRRRKRDKNRNRYIVVDQASTSTPFATNANNTGIDNALIWLLLLSQGGLTGGGCHNDPSSANNTNTIINVLSDEDFKRKTDNTNNNS